MLHFSSTLANVGAALGYAKPLLVWLWNALNSNFSAALFGALAGAYSANYIALRRDRDDRLSRAIEGTNTAIGLSNTITNTFIALKRQQIAGLVGAYQRQFEQLAEVEYASLRGSGPEVFRLMIDASSISMPFCPIDALEQVVGEKVGPAIHAGTLVQLVRQSIVAFTLTMEKRQKLLQEFSPLNDEEKALRYFGLRCDIGIDERYPHILQAILSQCDDSIYFSMLLSEELSKHGHRLPELIGKKRPEVVRLVAVNVPDGLLPDRANYPSFERQFRSQKKVHKPTLLVRVGKAVRGLLPKSS